MDISKLQTVLQMRNKNIEEFEGKIIKYIELISKIKDKINLPILLKINDNNDVLIKYKKLDLMISFEIGKIGESEAIKDYYIEVKFSKIEYIPENGEHVIKVSKKAADSIFADHLGNLAYNNKMTQPIFTDDLEAFLFNINIAIYNNYFT